MLTVATPGLRFATTRRGMTLLELLIAMVVLLVGIYTVARGFPLMLNLIRGEGDRTTMARLAEKEMARYARDPEGLAEAVTGGGTISPYEAPEDLSDAVRGPNAEESVNDVIGEVFRVPAAYLAPSASYVTGTSCQYVLRHGPAAWTDPSGTGGMPYVYLLIPLTEQTDDPTAPGSPGLASNACYARLRPGELLVPATVHTYDGDNRRDWSVDEIVADYGWRDDLGSSPPPARTVQHYVQGETVNDLSGTDPLVCTVHAAHLNAIATNTWGHLLPGQTRVWARHYFVREPFGTAYPTQSGRYVLENKYGAVLRFHPQDTGLTLKADYRLKTEAGGRRPLMMMEEQTLPSAQSRADAGGVSFADIRLSLRKVDDGNDSGKLFSTDTQGAALGAADTTNILAVDLVDGNVFVEGAPFAVSDPNLLPMLADGYRDGVISFPLQITGSPAPYISHPLRFYYRTLDRHNLQLQKAPRSFVDSVTASSYQAACLSYLGGGAGAAEPASLAEVDYRTYLLSYDSPGGGANHRIGVLEFGQWLDEDANPSTPPVWAEAHSCAGMTVAVNYRYWTGSPPVERAVHGELHTISTTGRKVALDCATLADNGATAWHDYPITILAVNGVSARVRAWWLNDKGVQKRVDIESCFLPTALGLLPRVQ